MLYSDLTVICYMQEYSLKLLVSNYYDHEYHILFKKEISGEILIKDDLIVDEAKTSATLKTMLQEANTFLKTEIKKIILVISSQNIKIYESKAKYDFQTKDHVITQQDLKQLINLSQNVNINENEIICLTKPCSFFIDDSKTTRAWPVNATAKTIAVNSLIYTISKQQYLSHVNIIKNNNCEIVSVMLDNFTTACFFSAHNKHLGNNNFALIDTTNHLIKISIFENLKLYAFNTIKSGYQDLNESIAKSLNYPLHKINRYLMKVVNLVSEYGNDCIIDSYQRDNVLCKITKGELQGLLIRKLNEILDWIEYCLSDIYKKQPNLKIILTGKFLNLSGICEYIKKYCPRLQLIMNSYERHELAWEPLLGAIEYQKLLTKMQQNHVMKTHSSKKNEPKSQKREKSQEQTVNEPINSSYHYNMK